MPNNKSNYAFDEPVQLSDFTSCKLDPDPDRRIVNATINMPTHLPANQESKGSPRDQGSFFERLVVSLPGMAFRCFFDEHLTMTYASPGCYQITGLQPEDLIDNRTLAYAKLIHVEDYPVIQEEIRSTIDGPGRFDLVYRMWPLSGSMKWVRSIGRVIRSDGEKLPVLEGMTTDISNQKETQGYFQRQLQRQDALRKIDQAILTSLDVRMTVDVILDQVVTQLGVEAADLFLYNPTSDILEYVASHGFRTAAVQHSRVRKGESLAGEAFRTKRRILQSGQLSKKEAGERALIPLQEEGYLFYLAEPLITKGRVRGVLELFGREPIVANEEWEDFLAALARQAAVAVDNALMFDELQRSNIELSLAYDSALESWSKVLEQRDRETDGHTQRVTELTLSLARAFKIETGRLVHIRRGAILHDIGKMRISDRILLKNGPLTPDEWAIIRTHPLLTYELLSPIPYLRPALTIPYCHHEHWDGSGYPRGLRGEQIPLEARIFAVADVWDSLTSNRPFRRAWSHKKAIRYIREQSGRHFDPNVVQAFLRLVGEA
jgi:PAS domain S-box-containing protein